VNIENRGSTSTSIPIGGFGLVLVALVVTLLSARPVACAPSCATITTARRFRLEKANFDNFFKSSIFILFFRCCRRLIAVNLIVVNLLPLHECVKLARKGSVLCELRLMLHRGARR
jgi:hypothetical protein